MVLCVGRLIIHPAFLRAFIVFVTESFEREFCTIKSFLKISKISSLDKGDFKRFIKRKSALYPVFEILLSVLRFFFCARFLFCIFINIYFVEDNEIKNILLYNHPLRNIDINLLKRLISYCKSKQFININYISSINGAEGLDFIPEYITLENEKLYLWGHNKKHNEFAYLRIDKINQVNAVFFIDENSKTETYKKEEIIVKYKLKGLSSMMYLAEIGEKIIEETPEEEYKLTIIATVSNKFSFLQKILSYGTDCLIISPDSIKKELLKKLEMMKSGYKDE